MECARTHLGIDVSQRLMFINMLAITATSNAIASPYNHDDMVIVSPEQLALERERHRGAPSNSALITEEAGEDDALADSNEGFEENPYGCYGQTENPHVSNYNGFNEVSLYARSACPGNFAVPFLWVQTQLYRETYCIGSVCLNIEPWGLVDTRSVDYGYSVRANSRGTCIDSWYHGTSAHMMDGWDGKRYYAFTSNREYVSGC